MARQPGPCSDRNVIAQDGTTGYASFATNNAIFPDSYIVSDLDQVVNFRTVTDSGGPERRPVYGGIRTQFDVVTQDNRSHLGNSYGYLTMPNKTETVGPDHRTTVKNAPGTDLDSLAKRDIRIQKRSRSNLDLAADVTPGMNRDCIAQHSAAFHDDVWSNGHSLPENGVRGDNRRRMNTFEEPLLVGFDLLQDGEHGLAHIIHLDKWSIGGERLPVHNDRGRLRRFQVGNVLAVGDEREVAFSGFADSVEPGNAN